MSKISMMLATIGISAAISSACAQAQQPSSTTPVQEPNLPPAGYGTLRQDQVSIGLRTPDVLIQVVPLQEGIIRLLSPDTYNSLRRLRESKQSDIDEAVRRFGLREPQVFYVSFFALQDEARFIPDNLMMMGQNRMFRPLHVIPLSPLWSGHQLRQRETATALYVYDDGLRILDPFTVEYTPIRNDTWEQILRLLDRERAAVLARAAAER